MAQREEPRGVYCRHLKDKFGRIKLKFEPRFKPPRGKQSIWLGQYETSTEAKIVRDIAAFYYANDEFGCLDFVENCYSVAHSYPEDGRYFRIPPLTENLEEKEKSKLVSRKAREVYKQFKEKQAEYWNLWRLEAILMEGTEVEGPRGDGEGVANGHLDARPFALANSSLQFNDQVGNSAGDGIMLDNHGVTSNMSSHLDALDSINYSAHARTCTSELAPFDTNSLLPLLGRHEILEGAMVLSDEDSQRTELPERHFPSYTAGEAIASAPFPNCCVPASGFTFNTGNQVQALLLQLVNTLQQENQELKQKYLKLQSEFREHLVCCSGAHRPTKRR